MSNRHAHQKTPTRACNSHNKNNARQQKGQLRNCQKDNGELTNDNTMAAVAVSIFAKRTKRTKRAHTDGQCTFVK